MTTRYKTEGEKAGVKRRMADYRKRLYEKGLKARQLWTTDAQAERLRAVIACWHGESHNLDSELMKAAIKLKPEESE